MGFAPTWLRQVTPPLHKTTLTTAVLLVANYTALVTQACVCVDNLPRVALDSGEARIRTRDLLIASPAS